MRVCLEDLRTDDLFCFLFYNGSIEFSKVYRVVKCDDSVVLYKLYWSIIGINDNTEYFQFYGAKNYNVWVLNVDDGRRIKNR